MHLKHNTTLLLIFSVLFLFLSCTHKRSVSLQKQIERAIDLGEEQPYESLSILDSIHNPEDLSQTNYMLYQIADVRANRNANNLIREDQAKSITKAATYFEKKGDSKNAFLANYYSAIANDGQYSYRSNTAQELRHYLKAYFYADKMNDSLNIGKTLYNIGLMYAEQNVLDSTAVYLKKAVSFFKENSTYLTQTYRLLAFVSYTNKDNKQALLYLDKGEPLLRYKYNKKYSYMYNTLYGIIYQSQGNYNQAISYLTKNMTDSIPEKEKVRTAFNLIEIYTSTHKLDSANYYVNYAEPKLKDIQENKLLLFAYMVLQAYYLEQGDTAKSKGYLILFNQIQHIIKNQNEAETLFIVDKDFKIDQLEKSQKEYQKILACLIVFILVVIVSFLVILKRIKLKKDKLIKEQEKTIEDLKLSVNKILDNKA